MQKSLSDSNLYPAVTSAKIHRKRAKRSGPLILILCMTLAVLSVLFVPLLLGSAAPAASRAAAAPSQAVLQAVEMGSLTEAVATLGFTPATPQNLPQGVVTLAYRAVGGHTLEIEYQFGKETVWFRAAPGSDDLSHDSSEYAYTVTETVNGVTRSYAGISEQQLNCVVWVDGDYSYALVASAGIDQRLLRYTAENVG